MTRSFKVQPQGDPVLGKVGSELRFRGQWLRAMGFEPGDKVRCVVRQGYIELAVIRESVPDPEFDRVRASLEVANAGFDALRRAGAVNPKGLKLFEAVVLDTELNLDRALTLPGWSHWGQPFDVQVSWYPWKEAARTVYFYAKNRREALKQLDRRDLTLRKPLSDP